jgi:hypothetical protein
MRLGLSKGSKELQKVGFIFTLFLMVSCSGKGQTTVLPITSTEKPLIATPTDQIMATATITNSYIGLKYPPLPSSIRTSTSSGRAIWNPSTPISWVVDVVMDEKNLMLWLSKIIDRDEVGHAFFEVRDILFLPPSARDKDFVVGECVLAGKPDFELVALVNVDQESLDNRWLPNSNIISAWRANLSTGKIEQISTEKIECNAETFIGFP